MFWPSHVLAVSVSCQPEDSTAGQRKTISLVLAFMWLCQPDQDAVLRGVGENNQHKSVFENIGKQIITAYIGRNVFLTLIGDRFYKVDAIFLDLSIKYFKNTTFQTSLAVQMSMLERFLKVNFSKNLIWEHHAKIHSLKKNPAYGRHQLSRPMRIVGPIQIWRGCVIYLRKKK